MNNLSRIGFDSFQTPVSEIGLNSVLIASSYPTLPLGTKHVLAIDSHRITAVEVNGKNILGVYFALRKKKETLFNYLLKDSDGLIGRDTLVLGDFNTGLINDDSRRKGFYCMSHLERLEEVGLFDLWRKRNPYKNEYSWFSNAGNGFRLDQVYGTQSIDSRVTAVYYSHNERENKISDHSVLLLNLSRD